MAQESLLAALEEDARAQADSIIRSAQTQAAALMAAAGEEAASATDAMLALSARAIDRSRAALLNGARVRAAALIIDSRRALMDAVFERSALAFSSIERTEYRRILNRWYDELKAAWDEAGLTAEPVVIVNPADRELLDQSGFLLKADPLVTHGLVFVSADGRVRFENTFASRLDRAREDVMPLLERILACAQSEAHDGPKEP